MNLQKAKVEVGSVQFYSKTSVLYGCIGTYFEYWLPQ